jgi:hypothetical protein
MVIAEARGMAVESDGSESVVNDATPAIGAGEVSSEELAENAEIQAAFQKVFGNSDTDGEATATAQDAADAEQQDELVESELAAKRETDEGSDNDEKPEAVKPKQQVKPGKQEARGEATPTETTLDAALRHAAKRAGWSDDEIKQALELNPDAAVRQFEKLHSSYNDLSKRYAELGQQRVNPAAGQQPPAPKPAASGKDATSPADAPTASSLDALFTPKALEEFGNNNGEELVEKLLKPLHAEVIQPLREMKAWYEAQQREVLRKEVDLVFKGWEGDFADLYGTGGTLTKEQLDNRSKVALLADQIGAGAAAQGIELSVSDALERANALFTADRRAEIERKQLTSRVVKRSARLTARPTQRKIARTVGDGAPKGDAAAIEAVKSFWSERGQDAD